MLRDAADGWHSYHSGYLIYFLTEGREIIKVALSLYSPFRSKLLAAESHVFPMKHFLMILLVGVVGFLSAPMLFNLDSSKYLNQEVYSSEEQKIYSVRTTKKGREMAATSVIFWLNLDEVGEVSRPEKLVTIMGSSKEFGLMLTPDGLAGNWDGQLWKAGTPLNISKLLDNANVVRYKNRDYLALMVTANDCHPVSGRLPGVNVIDASGKVVLSYPPLNTAENAEIKSIALNPTYISHALLVPRLLSTRAAERRISRFAGEVARNGGNPYVMGAVGAGLAALLSLAWSKLISQRKVHQ